MQAQTLLVELFERTISQQIISINQLQASGSGRIYFRILHKDGSTIGVYNDDRKENEAFIGFSQHFCSKGFNVPTILAQDLDNNIYLINDLGDETLYRFLINERNKDNTFSPKLLSIYKQALDGLLKIQVLGCEGLNFDLCYPRAAFDHQSIRWDLNYFKYYFLKLAKVPFNEQLLENDFDTLSDFLLEAKSDYFLYRDFQSRNIMLHQDKVYFIDYQGGRKGALAYDVASLLYDGKAGISQEVRKELLEYYIEQLKKILPEESAVFKRYYYGFVFIRIMQAMGSYGFRGFYEQKKHFLQSIPYALNNLKWLLDNVQLPINIPTLLSVFQQLIDAPNLKQFSVAKLNVSINSFSYKDQQPVDNSGNGGGYIFDCRCLPNPGRYPKYQKLSGNDTAVVEYLEGQAEIHLYFEHVKAITEMAVKNYTERKFSNLMINFGCTGGQHRSVYFANRLAKYLQSTFDINVEVTHLMQEKWQKK